jgi:hypothetical protein
LARKDLVVVRADGSAHNSRIIGAISETGKGLVASGELTPHSDGTYKFLSLSEPEEPEEPEVLRF